MQLKLIELWSGGQLIVIKNVTLNLAPRLTGFSVRQAALSIINCFCGDDDYYEDRNQTVDREVDRNTDILMIRILFRVCQFQL